MNVAKVFVILLCFLVCSGGAFVASRTDDQPAVRRLDAIPVRNPAPPKRTWLQV